MMVMSVKEGDDDDGDGLRGKRSCQYWMNGSRKFFLSAEFVYFNNGR